MEQNSKTNLWFKRKSYGWGWIPVSWQGYVVTIVYIVLMITFPYINFREAPDGNLLVGFVFPFVIFTSILIYICYKKGEKPKWQWGKDNSIK